MAEKKQQKFNNNSGKFFNYGTIPINMTNAMDTIVMKNINNPEVVRRELQKERAHMQNRDLLSL